MLSVKTSKGIFLYLLLFGNVINRNHIPGAYALRREKLNECGRCKVLTDSFNHWLEKTSRGKYEGGDTAWEEAKLKSYARSEIRFVEVQEGLCSELSKNQHYCYTFADEAEQLLEKWWFHKDPNTVNLYPWLCIETLKHCCPIHHYGEACAPCLLGEDNKICNGHGKCNGDGTRTGDGLCICDQGFSGTSCEECSDNYYADDNSCKPCDRACDGCSSSGPTACLNCKEGWKLESGTCTDIDECLLSPCKGHQYCINKEGSYRCKQCDDSCMNCTGEGPDNCTSCVLSSYFWNGRCMSNYDKDVIIRNAFFRMAFYIALLLIPGIILYTSHHRLAFLILVILGIYIYFTEKSLDFANVFDIYFRNTMQTVRKWFS